MEVAATKEIREASGEMTAHLLHTHGVQFEVLGRAGAPPDRRDGGLRDTVVVREPMAQFIVG
ncbi:multicopper oxidase domain-containing protein [Falsiroseomonas sp.]|uniref:multicopper oxidase domain-containing protein n=1 Tax=Falsiroseomonas sp. TaxID=2870721 RepID=UPI0035630196